MELQLLQDSSQENVYETSDFTMLENLLPTETTNEVEEQLQMLLEKGGPDEKDYPLLDEVMLTLYTGVQNGDILQEEINALKKLFNKDFLNETIHGYGYRKPMGYAGDFLLIDKIYTYHKTNHPKFRKWDKYFHSNEATDAVRNRKEYFKKQMLEKLKEKKENLNLLNVASGPARDLHELYQKIDGNTLKTTCVDLDARAIEYAQGICKGEAENITFFNKNILRFSTAEKFDVIWSAGLFDYFEDKIFVLAIKKFLTWLKPGGEIIVGNFSEDNSSRGYMELFGEWILIHRSKEELKRLSLLAGVKEENIFVDQEPLGINLFLRIRG
jgi:SAM-dependent methyltransferase